MGSGSGADAVTQVRALLVPVADPARAPLMRAYMKDVADFLGVSAPVRRAATREWVRGFDPGPGAAALLGAAAELVQAPEREFAHVAVDLVRRHERALAATALPQLRELALVRPWWDTVDAWSGVVGRGGLRHPEWDPVVAGWATDPQLWARRIALVFQVGRGEHTDLPVLFAICDATRDDADFFMRKGIGWALREASKTYPEEVRAYVDARAGRLSGLSVREATKYL